MPRRERSTRQTKLGPYSRSPYIERVIDINAAYTYQDISLWRYMIQKTNLLETIFECKGIRCIKEHMQGLRIQMTLFYSVIDSWATILNDGENYKTDNSPMRLFCTTSSVIWSLDAQKSVSVTYPIFSRNMNDLLERYRTWSLSNTDMIIFV